MEHRYPCEKVSRREEVIEVDMDRNEELSKHSMELSEFV